MGTYAIGDIQGCLEELTRLLDSINFDSTNDRLWFVGDLVNRGPASLQTLRFIRSLGDNALVTLGNHDLHLLSVANKVRKPHAKDTLDEIINADDVDELLQWIRQRPLLIHDPEPGFTILHAGLPPDWSLEQAQELARETGELISGDRDRFESFLYEMFGNQPDIWSDNLKETDRHRFIINCLTRMRYLHRTGQLDFTGKGAPGRQPKKLIPWYAFPGRKTRNHKIIFGHWSTVTLGIENNFQQYNVYPLDTGCVWGGALTAMRLEDQKLFSIPSQLRKTK